MIIPQTAAMLCGAISKFPTDTADYVMEEKYDGMRGLVVLDDNGVTVWNRHGQDKSRIKAQPGLLREFTDLVKQFPSLAEGTLLDGELWAPSWNEVMHLMAPSGSNAEEMSNLKFIVFDVLYFEGEDLTEKPWSYRRALLERVLAPTTSENSIIQLGRLLPLSMDAVDEIWDRGGEGVILKLKESQYFQGGRNHWFKLKAEYTADGVITRFTKGGGKYSDTFGAVVISQYRDGVLTEVSQMSGMDDATRRNFDPARDVGRVIEMKHYGKTINKRYRHPQWKRWRDDKEATDCTWEASEG